MAPHPPGPGLGEHAPSVKISTTPAVGSGIPGDPTQAAGPGWRPSEALLAGRWPRPGRCSSPRSAARGTPRIWPGAPAGMHTLGDLGAAGQSEVRSEEHTSELQSLTN